MHFLLFPFRLIAFVLFTLLSYGLSFFPRGINHLQVYRRWSFFFFNLFGLHLKEYKAFRGKLPKQYIVISNHPSGIDALYLPYRFPVYPLSQDEVKHWPLINRLVTKAGIIMVNREKPESRKAAMLKCLRALKGGKGLLIFPEGGCIDKHLQPFHNGAFELSKKTNVPILPVYMHYDEGDTYLWGEIKAFPYILRLLFHRGNRNAHLHIFEPLFPERFANTEAYAQEVFAFYKSVEAKLSRHESQR